MKIAQQNGVMVVPMKTSELGAGLYWTLNISPSDCTGCGLCMKNCPVGALTMVPIETGIKNQKAFDSALKIKGIDKGKLNLNIPKHVELLSHYFEFPGACAGCGETPYIRLMAHLFGEKMFVANATGCSSIYGEAKIGRASCRERV